MPKVKDNKSRSANNTSANLGFEAKLWQAADALRNNMDVALEPGFPRIGLINGRQLVDLLVEHWSDIPQEFQERLGLKPGLVRV